MQVPVYPGMINRIVGEDLWENITPSILKQMVTGQAIFESGDNELAFTSISTANKAAIEQAATLCDDLLALTPGRDEPDVTAAR